MAISTPNINTYHCICSTLLLASTHALSSLPIRSGVDRAIILPVPSLPPPSNQGDLPAAGYTLTTPSLVADRKPVLVRRDDGFERRILHRCARCRLVVGYGLQGQPNGDRGDPMDVDNGTKEKGNEKEDEYVEEVLYILPAGLMSTDILMAQGKDGKKLGEEDVDITRGAVGAFE